MGAVVVEDGAGAVNDLLVALDLRHDLLLHLQRREGNLDSLEGVDVDVLLSVASATCVDLTLNTQEHARDVLLGSPPRESFSN